MVVLIMEQTRTDDKDIKSENDTENINIKGQHLLLPNSVYLPNIFTNYGKIWKSESRISVKNSLLVTLYDSGFCHTLSLNNKLVDIKFTEYLIGASFTCITTLNQERI
jgi:hypothetical protein